MILEVDGIEHSFVAILCFPLAVMKCNLIHCHNGCGRYQQISMKLFIVVEFLGSCLFLFFRYTLQQVEDVLKEEKSLDILLDPTRIYNDDDSSSNFYQRLEDF